MTGNSHTIGPTPHCVVKKILQNNQSHFLLSVGGVWSMELGQIPCSIIRARTLIARAERRGGERVYQMHMPLKFMRCVLELTNQIAMLISLHG